MVAYYNENDPKAAQWLRNLIAAGHIAPGDVDERSIIDVRPDDLRGYTQCHFFAGVGVWSYALRNAGWLDTEAIWTGSCPCQPFSSAGQRGGFADERHLWPHFHWLIQECRPPVVFGEQVASKAVEPWIDLVQANVETLGYAFGCIPFPSAGVGAPHIRDRAYWVADDSSERLPQRISIPGVQRKKGRAQPGKATDLCSNIRHMADTTHQRLDRSGCPGPHWGAQHPIGGGARGMAHSELQQRPSAAASRDEARGRKQKATAATRLCRDNRPSPTNGFWRDADWLFCRDGKWRPVEPGAQPLAHGAAARVVRLRAYGNAINAEAAQTFIESWLEARAEQDFSDQ